MELKYSNKELHVAVKKGGMRLRDNLVCYYRKLDAGSKPPSGTIPAYLYPDDALTPFTMAGIPFNSARQARAVLGYVQATKCVNEFSLEAIESCNDAVLKEIYLCDRPNHSMAEAKPFTARLSTDWIDMIRITAYRFKFMQNRDMMKALSSSDKAILCYAHINDKVDGVYMNDNQAYSANSPLEWKGENRSGRTLMMVRDEIGDIPFMLITKNSDRPVEILFRVKDQLLLPVYIEAGMKVMNIRSEAIEFEKGEDDLIRCLYYLERDKYKPYRVSALTRFLDNYPEAEVIYWRN